MLKVLYRSLSSEGVSSLLFVTVLRKGHLHSFKANFLLVTLFERILSCFQTSHELDVVIKVLHVLLEVLLDFVERLPDTFVNALSNLEKMGSKVGELFLDFRLERVTKLLSISTEQTNIGVLLDVPLDCLFPATPAIKETLDSFEIFAVWFL